MPKGQQTNPANIGKSLRDLQGRIPHHKEAVECPVYHKTFDRFATIELMAEGTQGEIDYHCPYCDALVFRELVSPDRQCYEVVDPDHRLEAK